MHVLFAVVFIGWMQGDAKAQRKIRTQRPSIQSMIKQSDIDYQLWESFSLVQKANSGDAAAQHELGLRYLVGKGFLADTAKAAFWIQKAALQDFLPAHYNLGILYLNGLGVEWNPFKAYQEFKLTANRNLVDAKYVLGLLTTENLIVARDWAKAFAYIKEAAQEGFEPAKKVLKEFEKRGIRIDSATTRETDARTKGSAGASKDTTQKKVRPIFLDFDVDTSSHANDSTLIADVMREAGAQLRKALEVRGTDVRSSPLETLTEEADGGSPESLVLLGRTYEQGLNVPKDRVKAAAYYLRALRLDSPRAYELLSRLVQEKGFAEEVETKAKASNAEAQFVWSSLAAVQIERRITPEQALSLLQKAAEQKHIPAIIELGLCYQSGRWVKQDRAKAEELWKIAASAGSSEAQIRLASLSVARGVDAGRSLEILKQAMENGSIIAQVAIGYCYERGFGVAVNKGEAARVYREAAKRGSESAYAALRRMHDEIRPKDKEFEIEE